MSLKVQIGRGDGLADALGKLVTKASTTAGRALREEAEIEMTEAKQRTPVDTGALRASGRVEGPEIRGEEVSVTFQFGDAAAPYALYVHENMDAFHKVGQAKFLESTLIESQPYLAARIAKRIKDMLGL